MQCYNSIKKKQSLVDMKKNLTFNHCNDYYGNPIKILSMKSDAILNCDLPGYIITKEGFVIPVVDGDEHGLVGSSYLSKILGNQWNQSMKHLYLDYLHHLKAILYGRMDSDAFDIKNIKTKNVGLFFLYDHLHSLTPEQRAVIYRIESTMFNHDFTPLYSVKNCLYDNDAEKLKEAEVSCRSM